MRPVPLLLLALAFAARAEDTAPPADFVAKANEWMRSSDPERRQAAYRSWLQLGPDSMNDFEKALRAALKYHEEKIQKLDHSQTSASPMVAHDNALTELQDERKRVMGLIRTDWKKDGKKVAMLREEMEKLTKLHAKVHKLAASNMAAFDKTFEDAAQGMVEVTRQLERFEKDPETALDKDEDVRDDLLDEHLQAPGLMETRKRMQTTLDAAKLLADVTKANKEGGKWLSESMRQFALVINRERDICGLRPLKLEEKLSDAAKGHSADMARLGFFAHESPVEGKKTPWDRARLAGLQGSASGENIYMGSTNFQAAYDGWFASDGHRFIMFSDGPNILGVGISGSHWTMMTGSKN